MSEYRPIPATTGTVGKPEAELWYVDGGKHRTFSDGDPVEVKSVRVRVSEKTVTSGGRTVDYRNRGHRVRVPDPSWPHQGDSDPCVATIGSVKLYLTPVDALNGVLDRYAEDIAAAESRIEQVREWMRQAVELREAHL